MSTVTVRIFLAGSHTHGWRCAADHPSVGLVLDALSANAHPEYHRQRPLIRLVVPTDDGGERALCFLRQSLVAVELDPPLVDRLPTVHTARAAAAGAPTADRVERPRAVVLPGFLGEADRDAILDELVARESAFTPAQVISAERSASDDYDYRRARVLQDTGWLREPFLAAVRDAMSRILGPLGIEPPARTDWEFQITAHNHLDYFKVHRDNASEGLRGRLVSWVWYLHRQPRPFEGGELVLFDTVVDADGNVRKGEGFRMIEPADNTLVAFPSDCWHLVRAVRCPGGAFADSRFTVNGWLRDPDRTG